MKTKHNKWINLVTLLLLIAVVALNCTGCYARVSWGEAEDSQEKTIDRFDVERNTLADVDCYIITDTLTGVQYLYAGQHGSGGLCVLQEGEKVAGDG